MWQRTVDAGTKKPMEKRLGEKQSANPRRPGTRLTWHQVVIEGWSTVIVSLCPVVDPQRTRQFLLHLRSLHAQCQLTLTHARESADQHRVLAHAVSTHAFHSAFSHFSLAFTQYDPFNARAHALPDCLFFYSLSPL